MSSAPDTKLYRQQALDAITDLAAGDELAALSYRTPTCQIGLLCAVLLAPFAWLVFAHIELPIEVELKPGLLACVPTPTRVTDAVRLEVGGSVHAVSQIEVVNGVRARECTSGRAVQLSVRDAPLPIQASSRAKLCLRKRPIFVLLPGLRGSARSQ